MPRRKDTVTKEIRTISAALRQLARSFERLAPALASANAGSTTKLRRKLQLTPQRRAALKLQGQYMGYMRALQPTQKAKVKKVRAAKGIRAAIAAARRFAS